MKTILFVSYNELHVTHGGVHRVNHLLMDGFTKVGYRCLYLINKGGKHFYINNSEVEENKLDIQGLEKYLREQHVDYVIDQEGIFTDSFNLTFDKLKLKHIKLLTVFHSTPVIYEKLCDYKWLWSECQKSVGTFAKLGYLARLIAYPLWRKFAKQETAKRYRTISEISDKVVFLSKNDIPNFRHYVPEIKKEKCAAIGNALTFEETATSEILNEKEKVVLIVSRLNDNEKRISKALQIWQIIEQQKELDDWHLTIVGTGPHEAMLRQAACKRKLRNVSFEGRHEAEPYYRNASIFMMTSAVEGWGLTLTECMQRAVVPFVFDSYAALRDIVNDGFDGCVIPDNDVRQYANRMIELMKNKTERERMALNGLQSCQRFAVDKVVRQWVELIESL